MNEHKANISALRVKCLLNHVGHLVKDHKATYDMMYPLHFFKASGILKALTHVLLFLLASCMHSCGDIESFSSFHVLQFRGSLFIHSAKVTLGR